MARGVLGRLSSNPNQVMMLTREGWLHNSRTGHCSPEASTNIFMKTRGFTSPLNFLHAMCESREPDIKQITDIMLGSRGIFSELVDKPFASHDAVSIFQLTYESPMCQLALRVILKKLTDELNQIGWHRRREVQRPASYFVEVDWESLNFERIGKAYRKAVPATSELIEALCRIPRLVHGVHCTDSDESLQGTDHLGLCSPIPPDKKKIMSVVVMSLLRFAWSQRANLLQVMSITTLGFYLFPSRVPKRIIIVLQRLGLSCSYSPIVNILEMAAQGELEKTRRRVRDEPFMLLYDNFNIYKKIQNERVHNKNIQYNNTIGAVVFLKTQQGGAWPKRLAQNQQSLFRSEPLSNLLDWWIGIEEIGHFTPHDVLALLFESARTYMPRISEGMYQQAAVGYANMGIIYDAHGGPEGTCDPVSLRRLSGVLGRTKIFTTTGNMDFYAAVTLLRHVTDVLVIVAIMAHIRVNSFEQIQERMVMDNWHDIIVARVKKWIPPTIVHFNRKEKAPPEPDGLLENAVLLLQHGLIYRALGEAVTQVNSGRVVKQMQMLTVMFHGGHQSNYATECLGWSVDMLKTWSDDLQQVWLNHCIVNLSGCEGKWIEMDRFNEQLVNNIKAIYNPRGTPASDCFQREVIARLIILFRRVKLAMANIVGATDYSSQHSEVSANADIRC
ncbi:hypothetical protein K440DRAFT_637979 [Wilcoxina mikolae CBS 423.85]|nr:hypothetical protein K440DRAFT_637979 [Wilcoxina mikolae CBS 423.85]